MKKNQDNESFLKVPHFILKNNQFDSANKLILAEIYSLSKLPKGCYKSQRGFGAITNLTRSTISKRLDDLESNGYIKSEKIRPELRNSKKKLELILDKFKNNEQDVVAISTFNSQEINKPNLVYTGDTASSQANVEVVRTGNISYSPENIYNNKIKSVYNNNLQDYNNTNQLNLNNIKVNTGISAAQFSRDRILLLENKIIDMTKNGILIVQYSNQSILDNLSDYITSREEHDEVLPLLKELVDLKQRLYG